MEVSSGHLVADWAIAAFLVQLTTPRASAVIGGCILGLPLIQAPPTRVTGIWLRAHIQLSGPCRFPTLCVPLQIVSGAHFLMGPLSIAFFSCEQHIRTWQSKYVAPACETRQCLYVQSGGHARA